MGKYLKIELFRLIFLTLFSSAIGSFVSAEDVTYYEARYDTQWELGKISTKTGSQNKIFIFHPCNSELEEIELDSLNEDDISEEKECPDGTNDGSGGTPPLVIAAIRDRGQLHCGISAGSAGFSAIDDNGNWKGFDVSVCRAVAAAVLGDGTKVKFVPTTDKTRFTALASGEIDMLARDVDSQFTFVGVNYYDGQGFMVPKALGVASAKDLDDATVCIETGTTTELNLADFFRANNISYVPVPIESNAEAQAQYLSGACDVYTTDASGLAVTRATFEAPNDHVIKR